MYYKMQSDIEYRNMKGFGNLYQISRCGKIWSFRKRAPLKNLVQYKNNKVVSLWHEGKRKSFYINDLLVENYPEYYKKINIAKIPDYYLFRYNNNLY